MLWCNGLYLLAIIHVRRHACGWWNQSLIIMDNVTAIVHLDTAVHRAYLLFIYGSAFIPHELHFSEMLHAFCTYYVNKYADHHMHKPAY